MEVEVVPSGDVLELKVAGDLDNESAMHFAEVVDNSIREGWHRIIVRMSKVRYLSSAGIGALLTAQKKLTALQGFFGICDPASAVASVLSRARLLDAMLCDPEAIIADRMTGTKTRMLDMRVDCVDGIDVMIFQLESTASDDRMLCRVIGDVQSPGEPGFNVTTCYGNQFSPASIALGLGALGDTPDSSVHRLGEFMSVAGAVAQSPTSSGRLPDYSVAVGDFLPEVQVVYGACCEGSFSHLIRFSSHEPKSPVSLSKLIRAGMQTIESPNAVFVVLGECLGVVGTQLRKSPALAEQPRDQESTPGRFEFPQIRDWLSFSTEQIHRQSLALVCGVVRESASNPRDPLTPFLRPFDSTGELMGHAHASVFPYQPLKKRTLDLDSAVTSLFQAGAIVDVLHLLRDDRPISGAGETEFASGACWIAPISDVTQGDAR